MIALIDADIVAYRAAVSAENDPIEIALVRTDVTMRDIIERTSTDEYLGFITGTKNFRKVVYPEYKANRTQPRPIHLTDCQAFLISEWGCQVTDGHEADDALGLSQRDNTVICSIDKDLKQIPGHHFNWVNNEYTTVTEEEGLKFFWKQMLIGDTVDNLEGVYGIGKKKASKLIDPLDNQQDMFEVVWDKYEKNAERFLTNGICFYIWQKNQIEWLEILLNGYNLPEELKQEAEAKLKSTRSLMGDTSMVLT